ncbi:MAG: glutamate--tRNA ligase [Candidatus Abyssobacteria bacterium SURF_5]|uniref:Glutamate--tRNA ligase n=1 Tax=Abyssobacteria bacterium (strain SURF_5) TaxID=2093360 RepID=A0A3A4P4H8_ABYX5|nr:MAG: glutamate--tRNA ligase [Candidatus Abyssubacteria bacterium SURF_5]
MTQGVRARFAPSPTGYLHVGGARTALFNWLFARHTGGTFILRIEDTDQQRSTPEALAAIIDGLRWLGIDWDEGPDIGGPFRPYNQMARLPMYQSEAKRLLESGAAYKCFCTPQELDAMRRKAREAKAPLKYDGRCRVLSQAETAARETQGMPYALRFKMPPGTTEFNDMVRGRIVFDNSELDDFIILRSDGTPTYNFSVSVDDETMRITHVIRGEDHISNTPKQILLLRAMGVEPPRYAHVSLILGEDGARLSKRHGATAVGAYAEMGYLPEAMFNFLALLGWSPKDDKEILSREEMIAEFEITGVAKTAAIFNHQKLEWMNGEYIRSLSDEELAIRFTPFLIRAGLLTEDQAQTRREWLVRLARAVKIRLRLLTDIAQYSEYFVADVESYDEKGVKKHWSKPDVPKLLGVFADLLETCDPFTEENIEARVREYAEREGIKLGDLVHPARLALTGKTIGPGLFEAIVLLGRDLSIARLRKALTIIKSR